MLFIEDPPEFVILFELKFITCIYILTHTHKKNKNKKQQQQHQKKNARFIRFCIFWTSKVVSKRNKTKYFPNVWHT